MNERPQVDTFDEMIGGVSHQAWRQRQTRGNDVVLLGTQQGILAGKRQQAAGTPHLQPFPNPLSVLHQHKRKERVKTKMEAIAPFHSMIIWRK